MSKKEKSWKSYGKSLLKKSSHPVISSCSSVVFITSHTASKDTASKAAIILGVICL